VHQVRVDCDHDDSGDDSRPLRFADPEPSVFITFALFSNGLASAWRVPHGGLARHTSGDIGRERLAGDPITGFGEFTGIMISAILDPALTRRWSPSRTI
jgi:hypothetical protein